MAPILHEINNSLPFCKINPCEEIRRARVILAWSQAQDLNDTLKANGLSVSADPQRMAAVGHSRGGKVAAALALEDSRIVDTECSFWEAAQQECSVANQGECLVPSTPFAGVALLDPVDGLPCVHNYCPFPIPKPRLTLQSSLNFGKPTLVLGTGLGPAGISPCAPNQYGHDVFYHKLTRMSGSVEHNGTYHFVVHDYGHMDMLDDGKNNLATIACKSGGSRKPLRNFSGGLLVAFLQAKVSQNQVFADLFKSLLDKPEEAPVQNIKNITSECNVASECDDA